jgi:hypothetical protein
MTPITPHEKSATDESLRKEIALAAYPIREPEGDTDGRHVEYSLQAAARIPTTQDLESCQG